MRLRPLPFIGALLLASLVPAFTLAYVVPENDNYVTEVDDVLTDDQEEALEQKLATFDRETSNQVAIVLVTTMSGASIVDSAIETGRAWGVGTEDNDNGVIILAALQDREVTIQVGYGLEGALPDIVTAGIIEEDIAPHFRDGEYFEGLMAAVDAIEKHTEGEYTADRYQSATESPAIGGLFFALFIGAQLLASWFARSKSWWAGGVVGGVSGLILAILWNWWVSIPVLVILGLLLDYFVSKNPNFGRGGRRGGRGPWIGGGGLGGGSSGGGFGGFGGGSFGGGGARGKW